MQQEQANKIVTPDDLGEIKVNYLITLLHYFLILIHNYYIFYNKDLLKVSTS